jgi:hypothetical protein
MWTCLEIYGFYKRHFDNKRFSCFCCKFIIHCWICLVELSREGGLKRAHCSPNKNCRNHFKLFIINYTIYMHCCIKKLHNFWNKRYVSWYRKSYCSAIYLFPLHQCMATPITVWYMEHRFSSARNRDLHAWVVFE